MNTTGDAPVVRGRRSFCRKHLITRIECSPGGVGVVHMGRARGMARAHPGDTSMRRSGIMHVTALALSWNAAIAGPLDETSIPSEAAWILHVDMERMRASPLATPLRTLAPDRPVRAMESVLRGLGLDPDKEVLGLTLYGEDASDGVTVVTCTPAADTLANPLTATSLPDYLHETIEGLGVHSWGPKESRWVATLATVPGAAHQRIIVIASGMASLRQGIRVLKGQRSRPGDDATAPLALAPRAHSFVVLRLESEKLRQAQEGLFRSELFRSASRVSLDLGLIPNEPQGDAPAGHGVVFVEGLVLTESAEAAAQWERAMKVLLGLGGAAERSERWAHAARMASVWADGTKVHLSFRQDFDRVASSLGVKDTGVTGTHPRSSGSATGSSANVDVSEGR